MVGAQINYSKSLEQRCFVPVEVFCPPLYFSLEERRGPIREKVSNSRTSPEFVICPEIEGMTGNLGPFRELQDFSVKLHIFSKIPIVNRDPMFAELTKVDELLH
jgi:hypothetical protein